MDPFHQFAFEDIIRIAIASIIIFASLISILFVIWGGFLMIISGGNEEKIKPAVNHIRHAAIGIVFLFGALYVFPLLMDIFGAPYGDYAKPSMVFQTIGEIFNTIFGTPVETPSISSPNSTTLPSDFSDF